MSNYLYTLDNKILQHKGLTVDLVGAPIFPTSGLVAYWRMSDTGSTIYDSVGTRHATPSNVYQGETGLSGRKCVRMKGIAGSNILTGLNVFTNSQVVSGSVSLWIKKNGAGVAGLGDIFFSIEGYVTMGTRKTTGTFFGTADGGSYKDWATGNLCNNAWRNIILTWDNNDNQVFVDGVDYGSVTSAGSPTPDSTNRAVGIGCAYNDFYYFINGYLQDVGVWSNTRLSLTDAQTIYNSGTGLFY